MGAQRIAVVDLGTNSTRLLVADVEDDRLDELERRSEVTRLGSVRQTERHLHADPGPPEELAALARESGETIVAEVPHEVREEVELGIAVAGTPTSLAAIDQQLDPYDPKRVHGYRLELAACARMLGVVAELPLERRRRVAGQQPDRAATLVKGASILVPSL